jgi:hypothetical protein
LVLLVLHARRRPPTAGYPWPTGSLLPARSHHRNYLDVKTSYTTDTTVYTEISANRPPPLPAVPERKLVFGRRLRPLSALERDRHHSWQDDRHLQELGCAWNDHDRLLDLLSD